MNEFLLIAGMAFVTFMVRYPLLAIVGRVELPPRIINALRYVPVAVLTAISVPAVLMPYGRLEIALHNPYLVGGVAACVIAWSTRNLLATIGFGMVVFFLWRGIIG